MTEIMTKFVFSIKEMFDDMTKESLRIVYMGTPDFAVESLRCLVEGGYNVVGVVTGPDKAVGRHGSVLQPTPVKQYAVEHGLRVLQPERLKDEAFIEELRSLEADLQMKYTGKFELSLEGRKLISDCTPDDVLDGLQRVWDGEYDFAILTPPEEVGDVLFMQVANEADEALLQISIGPNGSGVLYEKYCSYEEAEDIFIGFIKEKKTPGIVSFKAVSFSC